MVRRKPAAGRAGPLWSVPIAVSNIPETGRAVTFTADDATRSALARAAGLSSLPRLDVSAELFRHGQGGVRAAGRVTATVEQNCVVSLEPLQSEVAEPFDLVFVASAADAAEAADVTLDEGVDEPPEALHDGVVDLGAIAVEFLLLGINPYPRKPGATFDAPPAGDPAAHPFAALAALKKQS